MILNLDKRNVSFMTQYWQKFEAKFVVLLFELQDMIVFI